MEKERIIEEISKLNPSQRKAIRKWVPSVRPGDRVAVTKEARWARVYICQGDDVVSARLTPRGRVLEAKFVNLKVA